MPLYEGRALRSEQPRPRGGRRPRWKPLLRVLGVLALLALLAHLPWESWRRRWAVVTRVDVEGAAYLDPGRVAKIAGLHEGQDLFSLDLERSRQALLLQARIAGAEVRRAGLRRIRVQVRERQPVLLVRHGVPWEIDSTGVLLAPFSEGAVADVPLLTGPDFERVPEGAVLRTVPVQRGLAWVRALSARELQLGGRVSEIDVSAERATALLLMNGTRVISSAWPPDTRTLSALRVVLADLERRGTVAQEVDLRFAGQVIVRPVEPARDEAAGSHTS